MSDPTLNNEETPVQTKSGRGLNNYFKTMLDAKRNNKESFKYNGHTYKRHTTSKGMVVFKKA